MLHTLYDTITFNADTLALWEDNLNTFSSDIIQAIKYQIQGDTTQANAKLAKAATRTYLSMMELDDLVKMSSLLALIKNKSPFDLDSIAVQSLDLLAQTDNSLVGTVARNILQHYDYYFPPVYYLPALAGSSSFQLAEEPVVTRATVTVYPNPTTSQFNFIWRPTDDQKALEVAQLSISDLRGRIVEERVVSPNESIQLDLRGYGSGLYFYQLQVGDQVPQTGKLILE